jgi:hypothetical protein
MQHRMHRRQRQRIRSIEVTSIGTRQARDFKAALQALARPTGDIAETHDQQPFHGFHFMRKARVPPSGHEFDVGEGESVLAAAPAPGSRAALEGQVDYGVYQKKAVTDERKSAGQGAFLPGARDVMLMSFATAADLAGS